MTSIAAAPGTQSRALRGLLYASSALYLLAGAIMFIAALVNWATWQPYQVTLYGKDRLTAFVAMGAVWMFLGMLGCVAAGRRGNSLALVCFLGLSGVFFWRKSIAA